MSTDFVFARAFFCLLAALCFASPVLRAQTTIEILRQPTNVTTLYFSEATFNVVARAFTNGNVPVPLTYQWLERTLPFGNWIEIPGATNATWVHPPSPGCTNTILSCNIRSGEKLVSSSSARLRGFADCPRLNIVSVEANVTSQEVVVRFDRVLDRSSAMYAGNYRLKEQNPVPNPTNNFDGIFPFNVTMQDPKTVVLQYSRTGLRNGVRYALHPSSEFLRDCCGDWSCGCGVLQDYPFGWPFSTATSIEVLQQPMNVTIPYYLQATFSIVARAFTNGIIPAPLSYQWQLWDGSAFAWNDILGATNATWVRPPSSGCTNGDYRCLIRSGDVFLFSNPARLTLFADCSPLSIVSVHGDVANQEVVVTFDEAVDSLSATNIFNYRFYEHGKTNDVDVIFPLEATLRNPSTVVLHFDPSQPLQDGRRYLLHPSAENLMDCCGDRSCGCGRLEWNPFGWSFVTPSEFCAEISRQPRSQQVVDNCTATFEVSARWTEGAPMQPFHFQWYRNGFAIPGANDRTFTTFRLRPEHDGTVFHAEVLGTCERLVSSNAVVRVTTNVAFVRLDSVKPGPFPNSVIFAFSSPCGQIDGGLNVSGADPFNYTWSGDLNVEQAYIDCAGTNVLLFTSPQQPGSNYVVTLNNIYEDSGYQLEGGVATGGFTAPQREPVPPGILRATTVVDQTILEWAEGGILQYAPKSEGPWEDFTNEPSPHVLTPTPFPCADMFALPQRFYRVRWPVGQ